MNFKSCRRWASFSLSTFLTYFLFLTPPMELKENYKPDITNRPELRHTKDIEITSGSIRNEVAEIATPEADLILRELDKAIKEIELRLNHESRWYEIKFIFIGAILLGFIALVYKQSKPHDQNQSGRDGLMQVLEQPGVILALAISVIVSITIDMHLRANQKVISQNGIWIANYVEPLFLGESVTKPIEERPFYGWESFLRAKSGDKGISYHNDTI